MGIVFDDSSFKKGVKALQQQIDEKTKQAVSDVATMILAESQKRVPHDKGSLQNSGNVEPAKPAMEMTVGYNMVYAARLHEHPEYHFQAGRSGKYLENPIKENLRVFLAYFRQAILG